MYVLILPIINLFLVFINFDIVHLFLPLDMRLTLVLLTVFVQLTCFVYYIGYWVSLYLGYSANEGIGLILVQQQTFHSTASIVRLCATWYS